MPGPNARFLVHQHAAPLLRDRNGSTSIKSGSLRSVQAQRGPEEKAKMRPNNTHTQAGPLSRNACVNQDSDTRFQALPDLTPALWALADWKTAGMRNPRSHAQDPPPDIPRRVLSSTSRAAVCLAEISCWSFLKEARSRCADLVGGSDFAVMRRPVFCCRRRISNLILNKHRLYRDRHERLEARQSSRKATAEATR